MEKSIRHQWVTNQLDKLAKWLTGQSTWIYVVLLLFLSYLLMQTVTHDSWTGYLSNFAMLSGLYAPILLYSLLRDFLQRSVHTMVRAALWTYSFIGHSFLLYFYRTNLTAWGGFLEEIKIASPGWDNFIPIIGGILFLVELAILLSDNLKEGFWSLSGLQSLGLEKVILIILLLLSLIGAGFTAFDYVTKATVVGFTAFLVGATTFLWDGAQFFLIYLIYYFFYYINHYFLIPKIFKEKGVIYYGFSMAGAVLLFYPLLVTLVSYLPLVQRMNFNRFTSTTNIFSADGGGLPFLIMVLSVPVIIAYEWFKQHTDLAELEQEKTATELTLLKQQINPHFFFNTLNNLYALSITKDEQTPEVVLQLSELMRYVIYRAREEQVDLEEEVRYLEDYIQLQQIRLHQQLDFQFHKDLSGPLPKVAPLLFIVLVENAFKHGIEPAEGASFLRLHLSAQLGQIRLVCENSTEEANHSRGGIGLKNLRRRLALLYPRQHQLEVEQRLHRYTATLTLKGTGPNLITQTQGEL